MRDIAYTWDEVENLGRTDPIFVIYNKVYNMTGFLHPGDDDLVQFWGMDATEAFEKIGHGESEISQLESFAVGFIDKPTKLLSSKRASSSGYGSDRVSPISSISDGGNNKKKPVEDERLNFKMEIMGYPLDIFIAGILLVLGIIGE